MTVSINTQHRYLFTWTAQERTERYFSRSGINRLFAYLLESQRLVMAWEQSGEYIFEVTL